MTTTLTDIEHIESQSYTASASSRSSSSPARESNSRSRKSPPSHRPFCPRLRGVGAVASIPAPGVGGPVSPLVNAAAGGSTPATSVPANVYDLSFLQSSTQSISLDATPGSVPLASGRRPHDSAIRSPRQRQPRLYPHDHPEIENLGNRHQRLLRPLLHRILLADARLQHRDAIFAPVQQHFAKYQHHEQHPEPADQRTYRPHDYSTPVARLRYRPQPPLDHHRANRPENRSSSSASRSSTSSTASAASTTTSQVCTKTSRSNRKPSPLRAPFTTTPKRASTKARLLKWSRPAPRRRSPGPSRT